MAGDKNSKCLKCKHSFLNVDEKLQHERTIHAGNGISQDILKCSECNTRFGNHGILQLHLQIHRANNKNSTATNILPEILDCTQRNSPTPVLKEDRVTSVASPGNNMQSAFPAKKISGLQKVRLEDCLRCDACSCIYLDEADYHKHMRNFHQKTPKKSKESNRKKCRACCKNCKCSKTFKRQTCITQLADECRLPYDIKDRWKKLMKSAEQKSDNTSFPRKVKSEPEDVYDYSHLLSQVEVSIKTEPLDDGIDCAYV